MRKNMPSEKESGPRAERIDQKSLQVFIDPRLTKVLSVHLLSSGEWKYRVHDPEGIGESRVVLSTTGEGRDVWESSCAMIDTRALLCKSGFRLPFFVPSCLSIFL
jgi:hypothetical protein